MDYVCVRASMKFRGLLLAKENIHMFSFHWSTGEEEKNNIFMRQYTLYWVVWRNFKEKK